jgi:multidrug efflux pump subunit AcrA (membrane-fusion protein)
MSTEQVDSRLVEETRQHIRGLVAEIQKLCRSDTPPGEFYGEFLNRVVQALAAAGGAVWLHKGDGTWDLSYQINFQETRLREDEEGLIRHGRLLNQVVSTGEGIMVPPRAGSGDDGEGSNPTDFLLLMGPIKSNERSEGVVEVFQRPGAPIGSQRGYLKFVLNMCELAGDYLRGRQLRHYTDRQALWGQLETFTRLIHAGLHPGETAYTIANEGRRLIDCDRVSVALKKGSKYRVTAISGQDTFDKRANVVVLLSKLATAVGRSGDDVWYTGDTTDMAPQVETAIQDYVDEAHSKTVAVLPLKRVLPKQDETQEREEAEPIGALIVEQIDDASLRDGFRQRVEVVRTHSSLAMSNALEHENLFLMPVWRALGKATWIIKARTLPKTLAVVGAVAALILALILVPADFTLHSEGTLEPVRKREVFAQVQGDVHEILVKHGQYVEAGEPLLSMRNTALDVELTSLEGQRQETVEQIAGLETSSRQQGLKPADKQKMINDLTALRVRQISIEEKLAKRLEEKSRLSIKSPADGQVVTTWDVLENLRERPVERGQVLLSLADPTGDWELRLPMPEDRIGHMARQAVDQAEALEVDYVLATEPGVTHRGKVRLIAARAEVHGEEGNTVLVKVDINKGDLDPEKLRPGASVSAKVHCGRRSIGYVYLHDAWAFVQRQWFRWF